VVSTLVIFLTEITSNTATASMMFPIMASLAVALGFHPYALMVAAAVAASFAFMLAVATPPNAVVLWCSYLRILDFAIALFAFHYVHLCYQLLLHRTYMCLVSVIYGFRIWLKHDLRYTSLESF